MFLYKKKKEYEKYPGTSKYIFDGIKKSEK